MCVALHSLPLSTILARTRAFVRAPLVDSSASSRGVRTARRLASAAVVVVTMHSRLALAVALFTFTAVAWASRGRDYVNRFPQFDPVGDYNLGAEPTAPTPLGKITSIAVNSTVPSQVDILSATDALRVQFWRTDVVRVWLAWGGSFSDEATADIITGEPLSSLQAAVADQGAYYEITATSKHASNDDDASAPAAVLRAYKNPLTFALFTDSGTQLWAESAALSHNTTATFQSLLPTTGDSEAFFGGGMQNGRFVHTGQRIRISTDYNWEDGGNPNSAPFYMSTAGYAVYRNTWAPGYYDFGTDGTTGVVVTGHNETDRFDAFYFVAAPRDFKALLGAYTYLVGPPFMPPIYALGLGDSDCYHNDRHNNNTRVVTVVADQYRAYDIPAAWFLPNDGYGCGFGASVTYHGIAVTYPSRG